VIALVAFLALFWTEGRHGKKGQARRGHGSSQSPVGGQDGDLEDMGNSSVTEGGKGGSPVGGKPAVRGRDKGGWWYEDGGKKPPGQDDRWWYKEKGAGGGSAGKESPVGGDRSPVGGDRARGIRVESAPAEAKKAKPDTGPDDYWWRD
jgi:hypothetical protein